MGPSVTEVIDFLRLFYRCDDCDIAFRIHGHLAKHLRSKSHVSVLERQDKVPPGTYAQLEKHDKLGTCNPASNGLSVL